MRVELTRLLIEPSQHGRRRVRIGDAVFAGVAAGNIKPQVDDRHFRGPLGALHQVAAARVELLPDRRALDVWRNHVLDGRRIRAGVAEIKRHGRRLLHLTRRAGGITAARRIVKDKVDPGVALGTHFHFTGRILRAQRGAQVEIDRVADGLGGHRRLAQQVEIHAVLAALEIEVDAAAGRARQRAAAGEQRVFRSNLPPHDDDFFPFAGRSLVTTRRQLASELQELILVAPDEIDLEQLELQVAALRLAGNRDAHQIGRLIVQAISHVEIGLGQRIALVERYRGAGGGNLVIDRDRSALHGGGLGAAKARHRVGARFLDHEGGILLALQRPHRLRLGGPRTRCGLEGRTRQPVKSAAELMFPLGAQLAPAEHAHEQRRQYCQRHVPIRQQPVEP